MPKHIIDLYIYFLLGPSMKSHFALERFYNARGSRRFVRRYAVRGKSFYSKFMSKYSREIREREANRTPFGGVMTPRGVFR